MVLVRDVLIGFAVVIGVTVLLLYIASKLEYRFNPRKKSIYKQLADGKKIDDHVKKIKSKRLPSIYTTGLRKTTSIAQYVPYNVEGIHEEITELSYPDKKQTTEISEESTIVASSRIRNKMYRYQEILLKERNEDKLGILNDELFLKIQNSKPENIEIFVHYPGLVFNYAEDSQFSGIRGVGICFTESKDLLLIIFFKEKLWLNIDLRKPQNKETEIEILDDRFALYSEIPDAARKIFEDKSVKPLITKLSDMLIRFQIKEDQLFALLKKEVEFKDVLNLTNTIFQASYIKDDYSLKVKELKCYNCGDEFDPSEEYCDQCGAPRPTCIVCLLDLDPSEQEQVMKLPCCGVYAHTEHIEQWLKKNSSCPNCHENLLKLVRKRM